MDSILKQVAWIAVALVGSVALGTVALARGERREDPRTDHREGQQHDARDQAAAGSGP